MSRFETISEVILYTNDVSSLRTFYQDMFDLAVIEGRTSDAFIKFGTTPALCLHATDQPTRHPVDSKIVFAVDDVEEARTELLERGLELSEIRSPTPGTVVCDGRDPAGHLFSIESSNV